jgi:hypothetical protein
VLIESVWAWRAVSGSGRGALCRAAGAARRGGDARGPAPPGGRRLSAVAACGGRRGRGRARPPRGRAPRAAVSGVAARRERRVRAPPPAPCGRRVARSPIRVALGRSRCRPWPLGRPLLRPGPAVLGLEEDVEHVVLNLRLVDA